MNSKTKSLVKKIATGAVFPALVAGAVFVASSGEVRAAETVPPRELSEETALKLVPARALLEKKDYAGFLRLIDEILPVTGSDTFDRALLSQLRGQILLNIEPPRYHDAIEPLETSRILGEKHHFFDTAADLSTLQTLSQLYYQEGELPLARARIQSWLARTTKPTADIYNYLATIFYTEAARHLENGASAEIPESAKTLIRQAQTAARESLLLRPRPDTPTLVLLLATHQQLGEFQAATPILEHLAQNDPANALYWQQLFSLYTTFANDPASTPRETRSYQLRALITLERANARGHLKSAADAQNHVALLTALQQYRAAAEFLESALATGAVSGTRRDWELLASAWQQQRDIPRAAKALQSALERHPGDAEIEYSLGRLFYSEERPLDAYMHLKRAVSGKLEKPGAALFLLTYIAYELQKFDEAEKFIEQTETQNDVKSDDVARLKKAILDARNR